MKITVRVRLRAPVGFSTPTVSQQTFCGLNNANATLTLSQVLGACQGAWTSMIFGGNSGSQ